MGYGLIFLRGLAEQISLFVKQDSCREKSEFFPAVVCAEKMFFWVILLTRQAETVAFEDSGIHCERQYMVPEQTL